MINFFEKHYMLSWFMVLLIAGVIFYFSSVTFGPEAPRVSLNMSILYHLLAYLLLGFFLIIALVKGEIKNYGSFIILSILLVLIYAASDEFHQLFVPGRDSSFSDFLIDSAGTFTAIFIHTLSLRFRRKKSTDSTSTTS